MIRGPRRRRSAGRIRRPLDAATDVRLRIAAAARGERPSAATISSIGAVTMVGWNAVTPSASSAAPARA